MSGRYIHEGFDFELENNRQRGDISRSLSKRCRYRNDNRSRSRSRSLERRRRRRRSSHSRSRSGSRNRGFINRREHRYSSRRQKDSRSRSRSGSRSHIQGRRDYSPSPMSRTQHTDRRRTRSRSSERKEQRQEARRNNPAQHAYSLNTVAEESNASNTSSAAADQFTSLEHLPLPRREAIGAYYDLNVEEPVDTARIHREMEEKLRLALAKEGKVYPPPKQEASHPVFANDGSFLEIFKKMQEAQQKQQVSVAVAAAVPVIAAAATSTSTAAYVAATATGKSAPPPPMVGRRRGGKILKTGVVAKQKAQSDHDADPKDFWSLYLAEVNKYKNNACESDGGTRPLVK